MKNMTTTGIIYSEKYLHHDTGPFHPESPQRLTQAMRALQENKLVNEKCRIIEPRKASTEEIKLIHRENYINQIKKISERGGGHLDSDTVLSRESYEVALLAAGGLLKACEKILEKEIVNAFALVRPPGHHAGRNGRALSATSTGFCLFNNIAIAAQNLIKKQGIKKILILDIDCHHGNGTQEIFYKTPQVLFISLHQHPYTLYPGTGYIEEIGEGEGKGYNINIPLPPQTSDDTYQKCINEIVTPITEQYKPQFILVSAGYDAYKGDPITNMNLTTHTYRHIFKQTLKLAEKHANKKIAVTLEGGYGEGLKKALCTTIATLSSQKYEAKEEKTKSTQAVAQKTTETIQKIKETLKPYWQI